MCYLGKFSYAYNDSSLSMSDRISTVGLPGYDTTLIPHIENQYDALPAVLSRHSQK